MLQTGDIAEPRAFLEELARRSPDYEETFMTAAQKLIQEGLEKGLEKGMQLGRTEGIQLGEEQGRKAEAVKIAHTMLKNGLDRATVIKMTGLSEDDLKNLSH